MGIRVVLVTLALSAAACSAAVIYVDDDAVGANDGTSWENAYNSLQDALADANFAEKPVEVRIARGLYRPDQGAGQTAGDREATFRLINSVTLKGGFAGSGHETPDARDTGAYQSILSGDLAGDDVEVGDPCDLWDEPSRFENSFHVVTGSGTDDTAVINGLTVTAGCADGGTDMHHRGAGMYNENASPTVVDCMFVGNCSWAIIGTRGAGMYNFRSSPNIVNCTFSRNVTVGYESAYGGGICSVEESSPVLRHCTFSRNMAVYGAGMLNIKSNTAVINCTFEENRAVIYGGGIYNSNSSPTITESQFKSNSACTGAGIHNHWSTPTIADCSFHSNIASSGTCSPDSGGGGMFNQDSNSIVVRCDFVDNEGYNGAGMRSNWSAPQISDCRFVHNIAGYAAGGMDNYQSSPVIVDCTFTENSARYGGAMRNGYSKPRLSGCDFADNEVPLDVSYSTYGGAIFNANASHATLEACTLAGSAAKYGGALYNNGSQISFSNCCITDNLAKNQGGAIFSKDGGAAEIRNCTLAGNAASAGEAIACDSLAQLRPSELSLMNCIIWNGEEEVWNNDNSTVAITYSDIHGGWPGVGNMDADPCFVAPGYLDPNGTPEDPSDDYQVRGDYHLRSQAGRWDSDSGNWVRDDTTSPCIDAGDSGAAIGPEPFPNGGVINLGAYGGTTQASKSHFGKPACQKVVAGDINGDCKVDFVDIEIMMFHWLENGNDR